MIILNKVFAVVVTFNRLETLLRTLDRLSGEPIDGIVLIDNASTDGTDASLADKYAHLHYLRLTENVGSAGGFARGMQMAHQLGAEWIWMFNDDSRPRSGALNKLGELAQNLPVDHGPIGFIKILHKLPDDTFAVINWKGVRKNHYVKESNVPIWSDLITFDGCLIHRAVPAFIGYPRPEFFMGTYEFDYCIRAKKAGFKCVNYAIVLSEDEKMGSSGPAGSPPWRMYYNSRNHLYLGLRTRNIRTIYEWVKRDIKANASILLRRDRKLERILFRLRAIRDALLGRMGRRYNPSDYQ